MRKNSDQLLFNEIKERLHDQFESIDSIDTKASVALGFDGAILAGLLNSAWFRTLPLYFLIPVLLLICLVTAYALKAFTVKGYRKDPEPTTLIAGYQDKPEEKTLGQLIKNFEESFNDNVKSIDEKKKYLNTSFKLLGLIVITISIIVLLSFISPKRQGNHQIWKLYNQEVTEYGRYK